MPELSLMWILLHTAKYCLTGKHAFSVNENVLRSGHKLQSESASEIEFVAEVFVVAFVNFVKLQSVVFIPSWISSLWSISSSFVVVGGVFLLLSARPRRWLHPECTRTRFLNTCTRYHNCCHRRKC